MIPFWKKTGKHSKPQSAQKRRQNAKPAVPRTAQQSIPMQRMFEDGTCRVKPNYYTRTIQYQDINYQLAQQEDKTAIFEEWCSFLNFFDSSIKFELSFVNMATDSTEFEKSIRIPYQRDGFDDVRAEYSQMLRQQLAKGNNGLTKTKFITFGVEGESMVQVKPRLDHIQNDLLNNFHRLGVQAKPLNGVQRLKLMHDMFNMDGASKFHFDWKDLVKSGLSVKDAILSADSYWLPKGESINGLSSPAITGDTTGNSLYLAGIVNENGKNQLKIYSLEASDSSWKVMQAAADVGWGSQVDILSVAGKVYVAYTDASGYLRVLQVSAENVQQIYRSQTAIYPLRMELLYEQDSLWISYAAKNTLELINVWQPDGLLPPLTVSGTNISGTKHFFYDNKWYAVYCDYFAQGTDGNGCIAVLQDGYWQKLYTMDRLGKVSSVDACVAGGKLYLAAANNSNAATAMLTYDGQQWNENILTDIQSRDVVRLVVKDRIPYVFRTSGNEKTLQAAYLKDDSWQKLASTIGTDINGFDIFCGDNTLYAVGATTNGIASVKTMKTVEGIPDPPVTEPEVGNGNVVLALPAGYDSSAKIYIDGVEAASTAWQNDESRRLVAISSIAQPGTTAKTAAAYQYNASGIPTGMYVWRLSYNGSCYTATAIPEFENLFSYHGFSVRYMGNTGLRCTFGIDTSKKTHLISASGLGGYRITEMGTLIMRPDLHADNPMVYGSNKVAGGRTYWVENGKVNNRVIRKVNGRDYFANVLIRRPENRYNTAYIFRPYAVMDNNGENIVIYGPEMSRSMYTVCKQILARGDFKPGTSGYQFLKNIVDTVEKQ